MKLVLAALISLSFLQGAFAAPPVLSVGWDDYEPYQIAAQGGSPGIDLDLARAILEQAGYGVKFVQMPWVRQLKSVETGELDIALDASVTDERSVFADFTVPYRKDRAALIALATLKASPAALKDLVGSKSKIGVVKDSVYSGDFETLSKDPAFVSLLDPVVDGKTNLNKLAAGRIPFIIDDPAVIAYQVKALHLPEVRVVLPVEYDDVSVMVSKKTAAANAGLMDKLNKAIALLEKNGTFKSVYAKYGSIQN